MIYINNIQNNTKTGLCWIAVNLVVLLDEQIHMYVRVNCYNDS